jgi:hypothetical protein
MKPLEAAEGRGLLKAGIMKGVEKVCSNPVPYLSGYKTFSLTQNDVTG